MRTYLFDLIALELANKCIRDSTQVSLIKNIVINNKHGNNARHCSDL